jgi:hypothetical protein
MKREKLKRRGIKCATRSAWINNKKDNLKED